MTIEITDEMRKVAGDAVHDHLYDKPAPDYASPTGDDFQDIGLAALSAALPIIEKQVREEAYQRGHEDGFWNGKTTNMTPREAAELMAPYRAGCPTCAARIAERSGE